MDYYFVGAQGSGTELIAGEVKKHTQKRIFITTPESVSVLKSSAGRIVYIRCPEFVRIKRMISGGVSHRDAIVQANLDKEVFVSIDAMADISIYNTVPSTCIDEVLDYIKQEEAKCSA